MLSQGDVSATIYTLIGICITAWALTMAYGLLFPERTEIARLEISTRPLTCIGRGAAIFLTAGLFGAILVGAGHNPLVKLFGWTILMALFLVAALGLAGIAMSAGERLRRLAPEMNAYAAFARGAAFLTLGCVLPLVGWFAFGPLLFIAAIGAGSKAAFSRARQIAEVSQAEAA